MRRVGVGVFMQGVFRRSVFMHSVENPVDERHGLVTGELARELQRFVDHHGSRRFELAHFVDRESQNVSIDGGHALDAPVVGLAADAAIDPGGVFGSAAHQDLHEFVGRRGRGLVVVGRKRFVGGKRFVIRVDGFVDGLLALVPQKQNLQRPLAGTMTRGHIQVRWGNRAISTAVIAAS